MEKRKRNRWVWILGGIGALTAVFLLSRSFFPPPAEATPQVGDIVTVFVGDLSASATASGQVAAGHEVALSLPSAGRVVDVPVRVGDTVQTGELLVQLETADLQLTLANAQQNVAIQEANLAMLQAPAAAADIASAQAALASAQANLDDLLAGPSELEIAAQEASLRQSEASVWSASAELASAQNSISQSQIDAAQAALLSAQLNLEQTQEIDAENPTQETYNALLSAQEAVQSAQARLDELLAGPDTAAAQGSVAAAAARYDASEANFALQTAETSAARIASAESQLAQAQATLDDLLAGPSETELATTQAQLEQARLNLQDAEDALADASLVAPFDGIVTAVNTTVGEIANGTVVQLLDPTSLHVVLSVDEVDVSALTVGQQAIVTLETWPDVEIPSQVTFIAPGATTNSSTINYEVHLDLPISNLPDTVLPRVGMTANAQLITANREDVLLLPNQAITADRAAGSYFVQLVQGETTEQVEVTIGLRDRQYTQILSGLAEGDAVQIGANTLTTAEPTIAPVADAQLAQEVETTAVFVGSLSASATASGQVEAQQQASLSLQTAGQVTEVSVQIGDIVQAGQVLVQLDTTELERAVANAEQNLVIQQANLTDLQAPPSATDLAAAQAAVVSAQSNLDDLLDGPSEEEIAAAQADVQAANADIASASARLNSQQGGGGEAEITAAQIALQQAQTAATQAAEQHSSILVTEPNDFLTADRLADMEASARARALQANADLAAAQEALDQVLNGDPNSIASAQASLASNVARRDAAQIQLEILLQGASQSEIASAESQLAQAQASLDQLLRGAAQERLDIAAAQVAQAEIALERAELNLEKATLVAPFDGVITAVSIAEGEFASGAVMQLVDTSSLEVVLDVDEIDLATLVVGQEALVSLVSYPDVEIASQIVSIAPVNTAGSDTVTYAVHLSLDAGQLATADEPVVVRVGMTADAQMITAERTDVLLLPNRAITANREEGTYFVTLVQETENGRNYQIMPVTIGLRDGRNTEITSGVSEGDTVLLGELPTQTEELEGFGPGGGGPPGN